MCRGAFARLHMMGINPRLGGVLKNVMEGKHVPDIDVRYLKRKNTQRSFKAGEVASYLETLYNSVAESLPEYSNNREDFSDSDVEDAKQSNILLGSESTPTDETQMFDEKTRFLPPGSMFDQYRQYLALGNSKCSFFTFVVVWRQHFPHLLFRGAQQHAVCSVCAQSTNYSVAA